MSKILYRRILSIAKLLSTLHDPKLLKKLIRVFSAWQIIPFYVVMAFFPIQKSVAPSRILNTDFF